MTEVLTAGPAAVARAIAILNQGGLVAIPTDTVYGVAAHLDQPAAVERLYQAKLRSLDRPIPVLIAELAALEGVVAAVDEPARRLAQAFWPGALTLVLPRGPRVSDAVTAGRPTVGVRWPNHPVAIAIIAGCGGALAVTSANRSGAASPPDAAAVEAQLGGVIDLIIDGGPAALGRESSILDCTVVPPRLLRAGAISLEALQAVAGTIQT